MMLPKNEKRVIDYSQRQKIWIYSAPFAGKTTFANQFPEPIFLNTDGNLNSFDAPYISIREEVNGRQITDAWTIFNEAISELQKGSDFKTVVVDLVEDTFEACRRYCYKKLGIEHESDNSFKAWDYVRNEFLTTMKRLMTLEYNIVLISHEDMSKDITKKSGDKITSIRPNIQDKLANKLAGMVDLVGRIVADGSDRTLNFKSDEVVFGGGRLKLNKTQIPLTYDALMSVYGSQGKSKPVEAPKPAEEVKPVEQTTEEVTAEAPTEAPAEEQPVRRSRRVRA